jgi:hypothetical protein
MGCSHVLPGWASMRHMKFSPAQARHGPKSHGLCLARHEPTGRAWAAAPAHCVTRPSTRSMRPITARRAARPIQHGILLWSCIKYYCGHVSSIQILWSSYSVGSKIHVKIKYLPAFCQWDVHGTAGRMGTQARWAKWVGTTRIKVWHVVLGSSLRHVGQHDMARSVIRAVLGLPLMHRHDAKEPRAVPARSNLHD